jgi:hypothetical protein
VRENPKTLSVTLNLLCSPDQAAKVSYICDRTNRVDYLTRRGRGVKRGCRRYFTRVRGLSDGAVRTWKSPFPRLLVTEVCTTALCSNTSNQNPGMMKEDELSPLRKKQSDLLFCFDT